MIAAHGSGRSGDLFPQAVEDGGQVVLELHQRLAEVLDWLRHVVQKGLQDAVQVGGLPHIHPHIHSAMLHQDGGSGVFKKDVIAGIAALQLALDFCIQVVVEVLGFPMAAVQTEKILDRAVWDYSGVVAKLFHQLEIFAVATAIGPQAGGKSAADALLIVRAAVIDQPPLVFVVALYVGVIGHDRPMIHLEELCGTACIAFLPMGSDFASSRGSNPWAIASCAVASLILPASSVMALQRESNAGPSGTDRYGSLLLDWANCMPRDTERLGLPGATQGLSKVRPSFRLSTE